MKSVNEKLKLYGFPQTKLYINNNARDLIQKIGIGHRQHEPIHQMTTCILFYSFRFRCSIILMCIGPLYPFLLPHSKSSLVFLASFDVLRAQLSIFFTSSLISCLCTSPNNTKRFSFIFSSTFATLRPFLYH